MAWPEARLPGSGGLPVDFLIKFWYYLGTDLVDVLKASYLDSFLSKFSL